MKARNFAVAVLAMSFLAGCGRAPPPNLTADQVDQILDTQSTLAVEQAALGRGRDALEEDRRRWAERERREPIIAESIQGAAVLVTCSLPMLIIVVLLWPKRDSAGTSRIDTPELIEILSRDGLLIADRRKPGSPTTLPSNES